MGEKKNACRILMGNPEGKRLRGRPGRKWVDNVKKDPKRHRMGWCGVD
jgi:hypothetical protein